MAKSIRVITLNTGRNEGDYEARVPLIAEALQSERADIILLQECFRSEDGATDTVEVIAAKLRYNYCRLATRKKERLFSGRSVLSTSDLAVLTSGVILGQSAVSLPMSPDDGERSVQIVESSLQGHRLLVANTHLTHLRGVMGGELRFKQLQALFSAVRARAGSTTAAAIIGGDLNTSLSDFDFTEASRNEALDVGIDGGAPFAPTLLGGFVGAIGSRATVVDHIFIQKFTRSPLRISSRRTILDVPVGGVRLSDHAAVVADIAID